MGTNEGVVYFALDGDNFNPDELTEFLGIIPSSITRKGVSVSRRSPKVNSWKISTEHVVDEYLDVYEMAAQIINQLKQKQDLIIRAISQFKLSPRLEVVLYLSMNEELSMPAIGFDADTIDFLAKVGAFIDIDMYKQ